MNTTTIDMRPEPFELPFKHEQLDILEENRQKLLKKNRVLGDGSIFAYCDSGTSRRNDDGETTPDGDLYAMAGYPTITKSLADAIQRAKEFVQYYERFAGERGGLNLDDCHEWGNARYYAEDRKHQPMLTYGIRLSFNDGTVLFFTIKSKPIEEL